MQNDGRDEGSSSVEQGGAKSEYTSPDWAPPIQASGPPTAEEDEQKTVLQRLPYQPDPSKSADAQILPVKDSNSAAETTTVVPREPASTPPTSDPGHAAPSDHPIPSSTEDGIWEPAADSTVEPVSADESEAPSASDTEPEPPAQPTTPQNDTEQSAGDAGFSDSASEADQFQGAEPVTPAHPMDEAEQHTTMLTASYVQQYRDYAQFSQQQGYAPAPDGGAQYPGEPAQYGAQYADQQQYPAQPYPPEQQPQYPVEQQYADPSQYPGDPAQYSGQQYPAGQQYQYPPDQGEYPPPAYPGQPAYPAPEYQGSDQQLVPYQQPAPQYPPGYDQPGYASGAPGWGGPYGPGAVPSVPPAAYGELPPGSPGSDMVPSYGPSSAPPAMYPSSGAPFGQGNGQLAPYQQQPGALPASAPPANAMTPPSGSELVVREQSLERPPPTAEEFAARRAHKPQEPEPKMGLPGLLRRFSFGMVNPAMSKRETDQREAVTKVRRNFGGLRQVTVVNPKGGAGKTVAVLMTAMTFGQNRGGYVLAWDNNETQGTLGMRAQPDFHTRTVRDVLESLDAFMGTGGKVGDLTSFVRAQGEAMFDVLASDESATAGEMLTAQAFNEIREVVSRFYKLIIVDTGNNVRAENWQASIDKTDQLIVTMSARGDSAETAARMLDHLEQTGRSQLVRNAVTVVSMPPTRKGTDLPAIQRHFSARTRNVLIAPYDRLLDSGEPIRYEELTQATREAWLKVAASVAEGI